MVKEVLEFLGRSSLFMLVLFTVIDVFKERLEYNWMFFIGSMLALAWCYLPLLNEDSHKN